MSDISPDCKFTEIFLVSHNETEDDRRKKLPILFWKKADEVVYSLLFKNDDLYSQFYSGSKLRIDADEFGNPILYESDEKVFYLTSDDVKLEVSLPFCPLKGGVRGVYKFYVKYCEPPVGELA